MEFIYRKPKCDFFVTKTKNEVEKIAKKHGATK